MSNVGLDRPQREFKEIILQNLLFHAFLLSMLCVCYFSKLRISLGLKPLQVEGSAKEENEELTIEGIALILLTIFVHYNPSWLIQTRHLVIYVSLHNTLTFDLRMYSSDRKWMLYR